MRLDPGFLHCNENGFRFINQSLKEEPLNINRTQYLYRLMGDKMEINRGKYLHVFFIIKRTIIFFELKSV